MPLCFKELTNSIFLRRGHIRYFLILTANAVLSCDTGILMTNDADGFVPEPLTVQQLLHLITLTTMSVINL